MSQNLQNFADFQNFQLDNLVDLKKCCKTRTFLQKSVPIQPKTSEILQKFAKNWQLPYLPFPRSSGDYSVGWSDAEARALADFDRALEAREEVWESRPVALG